MIFWDGSIGWLLQKKSGQNLMFQTVFLFFVLGTLIHG